MTTRSSTVTDEPRLLAARSELGYVTHTHQALPDEPEAVSADEQRRITRDAQLDERERQRAAVHDALDVVRPALAELCRTKLDKRLLSCVRAMQRQCDQLHERA